MLYPAELRKHVKNMKFVTYTSNGQVIVATRLWEACALSS